MDALNDDLNTPNAISVVYEVVKKINQAFQKLYQEGKFQEISNKWFGDDVATDAVKK